MSNKLLGRELEWWKTMFSLLQLIVVSVGIALFNFFLGLHDKRQSENAELAILQNELADPTLEKYRTGLQGLLLRDKKGIEIIQRYVESNESTCLDWQKAHFIVASLGAKKFYSKETIGLLVASWACHPQALGRDVEFLHVFQDGNALTQNTPCERLGSLSLNHLSLMHEAALLSVVDLGCPKTANTLFVDVRKDFENRVPTNASAGFIVFSSFTDFPTPETFAVDAKSLTQVAQQIGTAFVLEQSGCDALWQQLRFQPLLERIAFGRFVLLSTSKKKTQSSPSQASRDAQLMMARTKILEGWVREGLKSDDRTIRYVAVAVLASFKWPGYNVLLQRVVSKDPDSYIRQIAELALQPAQQTYAVK